MIKKILLLAVLGLGANAFGDDLSWQSSSTLRPLTELAQRGRSCQVRGTNGAMVELRDGGRDDVIARVYWRNTANGPWINYIRVEDRWGREVVSDNACRSGGPREIYIPDRGEYSIRIFEANCVRRDACTGCGSDREIARINLDRRDLRRCGW